MLTDEEIVERYKMGNSIEYIVDYCSREDYVERWHAKRTNAKGVRKGLSKNEIRRLVQRAIADYIRTGSQEVVEIC